MAASHHKIQTTRLEGTAALPPKLLLRRHGKEERSGKWTKLPSSHCWNSVTAVHPFGAAVELTYAKTPLVFVSFLVQSS